MAHTPEALLLAEALPAAELGAPATAPHTDQPAYAVWDAFEAALATRNLYGAAQATEDLVGYLEGAWLPRPARRYLELALDFTPYLWSRVADAPPTEYQREARDRSLAHHLHDYGSVRPQSEQEAEQVQGAIAYIVTLLSARDSYITSPREGGLIGWDLSGWSEQQATMNPIEGRHDLYIIKDGRKFAAQIATTPDALPATHPDVIAVSPGRIAMKVMEASPRSYASIQEEVEAYAAESGTPYEGLDIQQREILCQRVVARILLANLFKQQTNMIERHFLRRVRQSIRRLILGQYVER